MSHSKPQKKFTVKVDGKMKKVEKHWFNVQRNVERKFEKRFSTHVNFNSMIRKKFLNFVT